ncbi:MAG: EAL domain-containing protein [Thiotrichales bacterium]|nr:MAG: EAL domain-containing protein [Thiotrichales bacterium]
MLDTDNNKQSQPQRSWRQKNDQTDIMSGLLRIIYSSVPLSLIAILANSTILSIVQWGVIAHTTVLTWFGITNSLSLVRLGFYFKFKRLDPEEDIPVFWARLSLIISAASGLTWGAVAIWLFPADDLVHQVFTAFVIAGMCAGAVTTLSPILSSVYVFILCAMLPIVIRFFQAGTDINHAMAAMSLLFTLMLLSTSKKLNYTIRESLLLRHERVIAEETIQQQAHYDSLTNLPNRRMIIGRLKQEIARSVRHKHIGAVLFLDLDHFKTINDSLGHGVGDKLLKQVASRISQRMREEDTAARLGGDEFIILMSEVGDSAVEAMDNVMTLAEIILHLFDEPFFINEHELHVTVSIGIALFPLTESSPDQLLQKSDVAMYEAKQAGRNTIRAFLPEMQKTVDDRRATEKGLRRALAKDELELYYQPQVDADNRIIGLEALLRWNHPARGVITPEEFIGFTENTSLIIHIGDWVFNTACKHLAELDSGEELTMCINVSPRQFGEASFVDKVNKVISTTGVNPNNIQLEITEGMLIKDVETAIEKMQLLKSIGVSFSIDDFGTGYSSLAYLKRLPVDILKIDKSFVLDIDRDENDAVIVETIIAMAQHMKIDIVAEGVETGQIMEYLKSAGCRKFQGHLFARPMPFNKLLTRFPELKKPYPGAKVIGIGSS